MEANPGGHCHFVDRAKRNRPGWEARIASEIHGMPEIDEKRSRSGAGRLCRLPAFKPPALPEVADMC